MHSISCCHLINAPFNPSLSTLPRASLLYFLSPTGPNSRASQTPRLKSSVSIRPHRTTVNNRSVTRLANTATHDITHPLNQSHHPQGATPNHEVQEGSVGEKSNPCSFSGPQRAPPNRLCACASEVVIAVVVACHLSSVCMMCQLSKSIIYCKSRRTSIKNNKIKFKSNSANQKKLE